MRSTLFRPHVLAFMLFGLLSGGLLSFSLRAQSTPTPNPDFVDALWVSKLDKVLKLDTTTGTVLFELPNARTVLALAVDEVRGVVWTYDLVNLTAYSFNGALLRQTSVPPPSPVVLLSDLSGVPGRLPLSTALHVDAATGAVWLGVQKTLYRYNAQGQLQSTLPLTDFIRALSHDASRARLWVATLHSVHAYSQTGVVVQTLNLGGTVEVREVAFDPTLDHLWVALATSLRRYQANGTLAADLPLSGLAHVSADGQGGLWTVAGNTVRHVDTQGQVTVQLAPFATGSVTDGVALSVAVVADPSDSSVWVASATALRHLSLGGQQIHALTLVPNQGVGLVLAQALYADIIPPTLTITAPSPGSYLNTAMPGVEVIYSDVGIGVDPSTLLLEESGNAVAAVCTVEETAALCTPTTALSEGGRTLSGSIQDHAGNLSDPATVSFTVDTLPPLPPNLGLITVSAATDGQVTVSGAAGSVEAGARVTLTNLRTGRTATVIANPDGSFTTQIVASASDSLSIVAIDAAGNTTGAATPLQVPGPSGPWPPDPATVAPELNRTVATDLATATAFLYTGAHPIQTGVAPGTIKPQQAAVLRGEVKTRDGAPLPGVTISVLNHPELGQTSSRADGKFDLVVNGGTFTINYEKVGYLPAQRQVHAPWQNYTFVPEVVLILPDPHVTTIDLTASVPVQVARGSVITDAEGARQATLFFAQGTQAEMVLPDGSTQPLTTLNVRATEYTVGENGPAAMPGALPPTSGYTYAAELGADEVFAARATEVRFNQAVNFYVENFLNFPVGGRVPAGYYDRSRGTWVPSQNGRVIKILSVTNGLANLDTDGNGTADNAATLAALGITDAERQQLAALYQPGQSLWRTPVTHFTPWDATGRMGRRTRQRNQMETTLRKTTPKTIPVNSRVLPSNARIRFWAKQ